MLPSISRRAIGLPSWASTARASPRFSKSSSGRRHPMRERWRSPGRRPGGTWHRPRTSRQTTRSMRSSSPSRRMWSRWSRNLRSMRSSWRSSPGRNSRTLSRSTTTCCIAISRRTATPTRERSQGFSGASALPRRSSPRRSPPSPAARRPGLPWQSFFSKSRIS